MYAFTLDRLDGGALPLSDYRGQVLLLVNTASQCGFTGQYAGLEALYRQYGPRGLVVIGCPCNQFGRQEPGDAADIGAFCQRNYGVSFPLSAKLEVNGDGAHPLWQHLKAAQPGVLGSQAIKWNFTKFLVNRQGEVVALRAADHARGAGGGYRSAVVSAARRGRERKSRTAHAPRKTQRRRTSADHSARSGKQGGVSGANSTANTTPAAASARSSNCQSAPAKPPAGLLPVLLGHQKFSTAGGSAANSHSQGCCAAGSGNQATIAAAIASPLAGQICRPARPASTPPTTPRQCAPQRKQQQGHRHIAQHLQSQRHRVRQDQTRYTHRQPGQGGDHHWLAKQPANRRVAIHQPQPQREMQNHLHQKQNHRTRQRRRAKRQHNQGRPILPELLNIIGGTKSQRGNAQ